MVTKEQAMTATRFIQIAKLDLEPRINYGSMLVTMEKKSDRIIPLAKPNNWRASGKCKTWVSRPEEFKLPIKCGLYESSYLTHENAHLFEVAE